MSVAGLRFGWLVLVAQAGNVNQVRRRLPEILKKLEEAGLSEVSDYSWGRGDRVGGELIRSGDIQAAHVSLSMEPGVVGITGPSGWSG